MSLRCRVGRSVAYSLIAAAGCVSNSPPAAPVHPSGAAAPVAHSARETEPTSSATALRFADLIATGGEPGPSELAQRLAGQRVRMVGFMAQLEHLTTGAFYLTPRPVSCDEAGAGTGDLPIESVLVSVPFMSDAPVPHLDGALEVTGRFETGARVDAAGYASSFRIQLDAPSGGQLTRAAAAAK